MTHNDEGTVAKNKKKFGYCDLVVAANLNDKKHPFSDDYVLILSGSTTDSSDPQKPQTSYLIKATAMFTGISDEDSYNKAITSPLLEGTKEVTDLKTIKKLEKIYDFGYYEWWKDFEAVKTSIENKELQQKLYDNDEIFELPEDNPGKHNHLYIDDKNNIYLLIGGSSQNEEWGNIWAEWKMTSEYLQSLEKKYHIWLTLDFTLKCFSADFLKRQHDAVGDRTFKWLHTHEGLGKVKRTQELLKNGTFEQIMYGE